MQSLDLSQLTPLHDTAVELPPQYKELRTLARKIWRYVSIVAGQASMAGHRAIINPQYQLCDRGDTGARVVRVDCSKIFEGILKFVFEEGSVVAFIALPRDGKLLNFVVEGPAFFSGKEAGACGVFSEECCELAVAAVNAIS